MKGCEREKSAHLPVTKNPQTAGIILAGGTAERLGLVVKANLKIGGRTLLERSRTSIKANCAHLILSSGTHSPALFDDAGGLICVGDDGQGPARALLKGASYIQEHLPDVGFLVSVAVDAPFLPSDFIGRAMKLLTGDVDAVVAAFDTQTYPTNSLWRLPTLARFSEATDPEIAQNAPRSLFGILKRVRWVELDYTPLTSKNPFVNVNTPADLVACNQRARTD
ncbi:hypothetical protein MNBD_ALPHA12-85 [hydrothermal vent metagenome]|uniref:MobA-like NTP transferase domain-containing protein n=1 Tax=hydrothermal vent metagenome TaxID=652676 RepID=A0A3B0U895_9ZZZZ